MKTVIRKMGNSQGVLIPKPFLAQVGLHAEAEIAVENEAIVLRKPRRSVREGWAAASKAVAIDHDDALIWPELVNRGDSKLVW